MFFYLKKLILNINWVKWFLISIGMILSIFLLLIPLISIFYEAFHQGYDVFLKNLNNYDMHHAIYMTLLISIITIPINIMFGTLTAWLVTRFVFIGKNILITILNLPFAISPVVVGLMYLLVYGINGPIGKWLDNYDIQVIFSLPGMILVTVFVTCPFVLIELIPIMLHQGSHEEEAAILLGASGWKMFWYITLPNIKLALLYGIVLTNARAIGEFGAISIISGLIRGETYTLPLQIELLYQDYNIVGAFTAAVILTTIAIFLLFLKKIIKWKLNHRFSQVYQGH